MQFLDEFRIPKYLAPHPMDKLSLASSWQQESYASTRQEAAQDPFNE